jgi:hypothetical protein
VWHERYPLKVITQTDLCGTRRLHILQFAEGSRCSIVAVDELLTSAIVCKIVDIQIGFYRLAVGNSELSSDERVPLDQPRAPYLPNATIRILETVCCSQWIRDSTSTDRKRGWTVLPSIGRSESRQRRNYRAPGRSRLSRDGTRKTNLPACAPGNTRARLIPLPHTIASVTCPVICDVSPHRTNAGVVCKLSGFDNGRWIVGLKGSGQMIGRVGVRTEEL